MPEVAEVAIVAEQIDQALRGEVLNEVVVSDVRLDAFALASAALAGAKLLGVRRYGKLIGLDFANCTIEIHLRMTGTLTFIPTDDARAELRFADRILSFRDPRRFGTLKVVAPEAFADGLAPDILTGPVPVATQVRSVLPVKAVLLDQRKLVSGLGNWMCDELLFSQRLHPATPASALTPRQWEELLSVAHELAKRAFAAGGVSMRNYEHPDGSKGHMQEQLVCYGHAGLPCGCCGTTLAHTRVAGRGTTFCPACQASTTERSNG